MLKKTLAIFLSILMLMACLSFGVSAGEYGYGYKDTITSQVIVDGATAIDMSTNDDDGSKKYIIMNANGSTAEEPNNKAESNGAYWYMYEGNTNLHKANASVSGYAGKYQVRLSNGNSKDFLFDFIDNLYAIDTITNGYSGLNIYSTSSSLRGNLKLVQTLSTKVASQTMTYEIKVKFDSGFCMTDFMISTGMEGNYGNRTINAFRITSDGVLTSSQQSHGTNATNIATLVNGTEYTIGTVITLIPSTKTSGKYDFIKSIYLNGVNVYNVKSNTDAPISATDFSFWGFDIEAYPWTVDTTFTGYADLDAGYCYTSSSLTAGQYVTNKYTILPVKMAINDFYVYAGNKYATEISSLTSDVDKFYVTDDTDSAADTYTFTAVGDATDAAKTSEAVAVTVSYGSDGILDDVDISPLSIAAGVYEADITLAESSDMRVMFVDSMTNLKPLTKLTKIK